MGSIDDVRKEVQGWLADNWALDITVREWWRRLADAGLSQPTWPAPLGRGWESAKGRVVTEELAKVGAIAPPEGILGTRLGAPTILEHGTEEQRHRYLMPMLRGEEAWCQLFSEPGAGSDLARLSTRAVRDGDEWVVNGQKVWNSGADMADRGLLLARTDVSVPKHAGITFFVLDMHQPGVDARPLRQMNGETNFCEVFITDARVSDRDILGTAGSGWKVTSTTLGHERAATGVRPARGIVTLASGARAGNLDRVVGQAIEAPQVTRAFAGNAVPSRRLVELARSFGVADDPEIRQKLAYYYTLTELSRWTQQRAKEGSRAFAAGIAPALKLSIARICHTSREVAFSIMGPATMLDGSDAPFGGDLHRNGLGSFGASIGGGTDQVQRNNLGERTLGLPREPQVDRDVPFSELGAGTAKGEGSL